MQLKKLETPGIAHYAYLLSDGAGAALVDPQRDAESYLAAARKQAVIIRFVVETHR